MGGPGIGGLKMGGPAIIIPLKGSPPMGSPRMGSPVMGGPGMGGPNLGQQLGPMIFFNQNRIMTWYFLRVSGELNNYDDASCISIEEAYNNNMPYVELLIAGNIYIIDLKYPFSQRNKKLGNFRREVIRNDGIDYLIQEYDKVIWLWKSNNNQFEKYEPKNCVFIERAFQGGKYTMLIMGSNGTAYLIKFNDEYYYQENYETKIKREIRRLVL